MKSEFFMTILKEENCGLVNHLHRTRNNIHKKVVVCKGKSTEL